MAKYLYLLAALLTLSLSSCDKEDPVWSQTNGIPYVDLGLPSGLKWAEYNVGARNSHSSGTYYAWGETLPREEYTSMSRKGLYMGYKWYMQGLSDKYFVQYLQMQPEDDAATVKFGGSWHTPTVDDWRELVRECKWEVSEVGGVKGYKVTGKNGKFIFLPALGYMRGRYIYGSTSNSEYHGPDGWYWSSSLSENFRTQAYRFYVATGDNAATFGYNVGSNFSLTVDDRTVGGMIRAVTR